MKKPINIRLNKQSILVLEDTVRKTNKTKTQVVEDALNYYYKKKISKNPLMELAGSWSKEDAKIIMDAINSSIVNAEDIKL